MLKPKMVFNALAVWFFFHIVIFWFMNPVGVEAFIDSEKGQLLGRQLGYIGGTCCIIIGVVMILLRDLDLALAKKVLLGVGGSLIILDAILIATNNSAMNKFPDEPMLQTPLPAVILWIGLTAYTLYVGFTAED